MEEKILFDQFIRRISYGKSIKELDLKGLHAGNTFYCYCLHCGIPTEAFPEKPIVEPKQTCSQCDFLNSKDILNQAKEISKKFFSFLGDEDEKKRSI